nr:hypothetical protein Iba_chr07dCG9850 [Ipomoea batatas]
MTTGASPSGSAGVVADNDEGGDGGQWLTGEGSGALAMLRVREMAGRLKLSGRTLTMSWDHVEDAGDDFFEPRTWRPRDQTRISRIPASRLAPPSQHHPARSPSLNNFISGGRLPPDHAPPQRSTCG